jgi:hypothetical protein
VLFRSRFNRFFYQVGASGIGYRYQDYTQVNNALSAGNRDRNEFSESLRGGYEILEGFDVWAQGAVNQRSYLQYTNAANQQRDSTGWTMTGGSTLDLGVTKLEGFIGYTQQNYFNPGVTTGAMSFGLGGVWNGYAPLVVRPFLIRSINESAFTNYENYISTTIGAEFRYTIQEGWVLNAGASYSLLDYTPVPGVAGAFQHTDDYTRASVGLMYSIRPQLQVGPLYEFTSGYGPDPTTSPNYSRHVVMVRLVLKK